MCPWMIFISNDVNFQAKTLNSLSNIRERLKLLQRCQKNSKGEKLFECVGTFIQPIRKSKMVKINNKETEYLKKLYL